MANTSSAKKAERIANRRRVFNARRKKAMKDIVKDVSKLILGKKGAEAVAMLPALYQAVDKAAKRGVIKSNAAARIKSRIMNRLDMIAA